MSFILALIVAGIVCGLTASLLNALALRYPRFRPTASALQVYVTAPLGLALLFLFGIGAMLAFAVLTAVGVALNFAVAACTTLRDTTRKENHDNPLSC